MAVVDVQPAPAPAPAPAAGRTSPTLATDRRRRRNLALIVLGVLALAVFDAWTVAAYVRNELARLEPWKAAMVCAGDGVAAAWFVRFAIAHFLLRKPLRDRPLGRRTRAAVAWFIASMAAGLAVDAAFTVYLRYDDLARYKIATPATAHVRNVDGSYASEGRNYELACEWRDAATGRTFAGTLRVHADGGRRASERDVETARLAKHGLATSRPITGFPPNLPWDTALALASDRPPATVQIRYDPQWPARAWLEGVPEDDNGLFFVSLAILFVQGWVTLIVAVAAWGRASAKRRRDRVLPWWLDLAKVIPTAAEVVMIAFVQLMLLAIGGFANR
jgi:hypothetical protein